MSLPHALLTSLVERPGSGLELARRFEKSIGYYWSATHQQIYRELSKLEKEGLITSEPEADARGRKRVYEVLPAGREELVQWVEREDDRPPLRDAMLVRLRAEAAIGPTHLQDTIRNRLKAHERKLEEYQMFKARDFSDDPENRVEALHRLILETGIKHERVWIEVLSEALKIVMLEDAQ